MFDLMNALKLLTPNYKFTLRTSNTHRARYLHHDAATEQDIIVVIYNDLTIGEPFTKDVLAEKATLTELLEKYEHDSAMTIRCEVRQL